MADDWDKMKVAEADEWDSAKVADVPKPVLRNAADPVNPDAVDANDSFGEAAKKYATTGAASFMEDYPAIGGFAGEIAGLGSAVKNSGLRALGVETGDSAGFMDKYREERDALDKGVKQVREANPKVSTGVGLATQFGVPIPGIGKGTAAVKLGKMAALGGLEAFSRGNADLTKGEIGKSLLETGEGAGTSYAFGALTDKLGKSGAMSEVRKRILDRIGKAKADSLAKSSEDVAEGIQSAIGGEGQKTSVANRTIELLTEAMNSPDPDIVARAKAFVEGPEGQALKRQIYLNTLDHAPGRMAELNAARATLAEQRLRDPVKESAEFLSKSTLKEDVLPRAQTYLERTVPTAMGGLFGGPAGAAVGGATAMTLGKPSTAIRNMTANPRFRLRTGQAMELPFKISEGAADFAQNRLGGGIAEGAGKLGVDIVEKISASTSEPGIKFDEKAGEYIKDAIKPASNFSSFQDYLDSVQPATKEQSSSAFINGQIGKKKEELGTE